MATRIECPHTPSAIKRAGQTLRRRARGDARATDEKVAQAEEIGKLFRAAHQYPLSKANMGLRSMVSTEGCSVEISQRLKRWPTILNKLEREPSLDLSRMQDIGGCRAILASIDEIKRVEARIRKNRKILGYADYIAAPRPSGYRGVHIVVEYDQRAIEVQLRTQPMHEWAITMEQIGGSLGMFLKTEGDHPVQALMSAVSQAMADQESGRISDEGLLSTIRHLRGLATQSLKDKNGQG